MHNASLKNHPNYECSSGRWRCFGLHNHPTDPKCAPGLTGTKKHFSYRPYRTKEQPAHTKVDKNTTAKMLKYLWPTKEHRIRTCMHTYVRAAAAAFDASRRRLRCRHCRCPECQQEESWNMVCNDQPCSFCFYYKWHLIAFWCSGRLLPCSRWTCAPLSRLLCFSRF